MFKLKLRASLLFVIVFLILFGVPAEGSDDLESELCQAAKFGKLSTVKKHIQEEGISAESRDFFGYNPLYYAAKFGHLNVVKFLVNEAGADMYATDASGWIPLHYAGRHLHILKFFIEEAHIDPEIEVNNPGCPVDGLRISHIAAADGDFDTMQFLVNLCHVNIEALASDGRTPLHLAAKRGKLEIVKFLVDKAHADIGATDCFDYTALHAAAFGGHTETVKFLVSKSPKPISSISGLLDAAFKGYCIHDDNNTSHLQTIDFLLNDADAEIGNLYHSGVGFDVLCGTCCKKLEDTTFRIHTPSHRKKLIPILKKHCIHLQGKELSEETRDFYQDIANYLTPDDELKDLIRYIDAYLDIQGTQQAEQLVVGPKDSRRSP